MLTCLYIIALCSFTINCKSPSISKPKTFIQFPDPKLRITEDKLTPIANSSLPGDFSFYEIQGESYLKSNLLLSQQPSENSNYIIIADYKGEVLWYKKSLDHGMNLFKKNFNSRHQARYTYFHFRGGNLRRNKRYELIVMDEYFQEIERIRGRGLGYAKQGSPITHEYVYLDEGHHVIVPIYFNEDWVEFTIEEVKDNRVIFYFHSKDCPELKRLSMNDRKDGDYAHLNSIKLTPEGDFLVSIRNIGIVKISRRTREILWVIGRTRNDFDGIPSEYLPFRQHDARIFEDGSITVWDNNGYDGPNSRVMRYWLDEGSMNCTRYREYVYPAGRSDSMGGAKILDDAKDIISITFGSVEGEKGYWTYIEYDFKNNKPLMQLRFNNRRDIYKIER